MFQSLFPPPEGTTDGKYQWKYNRDAQHRKIYIENNVIFKCQVCDNGGTEKDCQRSEI
jgi:predicted HNH restriction endonuclease